MSLSLRLNLLSLNQRTLGGSIATGISLSGSSVSEDATSGTVVATLSIVGPDYLAPATFLLTADPSNNFEIVGSQLRVKAGSTLDYETATFHNISLQATDANPTVYTRDVSILVLDVVQENQPPTAIFLSRNTVPENSPGGYCIGTLTTQDAG